MKKTLDFPLIAGNIINSPLDQYTRVALIQELSKKKEGDYIETYWLLKRLKAFLRDCDEKDKIIVANYIAYVEYLSGIAAEKILSNEDSPKTFIARLLAKKN